MSQQHKASWKTLVSSYGSGRYVCTCGWQSAIADMYSPTWGDIQYDTNKHLASHLEEASLEPSNAKG